MAELLSLLYLDTESRGLRATSHRCYDSHCIFRNLCLIDGAYTYYSTDGKSTKLLSTFLANQPDGSLQFKSTIHENADNIMPRNVMHIHIQTARFNNSLPFWRGNYTELHRYWPRNIGHTLGDDVFAIFHGLSLWGLDALETNLEIFADDLQAAEPFELVTASQIRLRPDINVCFETFYGGWQGHGFVTLSAAEMIAYDGRNPVPEVSKHVGDILRGFRNNAWRVYNIRSSPDCITIISKDLLHSEHPYYVENMEELRAALSSVWDGCIQMVVWQGMPMKEQVQAMANSAAVFTLPGSDCMNAVFLPDGSKVVVPDRRANGSWQGSNEFRMWFKHAQWLVFDHYRPHQLQLRDNTIRVDIADTIHRLLPNASLG